MAYSNVFAELTASQKPRVRLLPISSGVFAANFLPSMPAMTFHAMVRLCPLCLHGIMPYW